MTSRRTFWHSRVEEKQLAEYEIETVREDGVLIKRGPTGLVRRSPNTSLSYDNYLAATLTSIETPSAKLLSLGY